MQKRQLFCCIFNLKIHEKKTEMQKKANKNVSNLKNMQKRMQKMWCNILIFSATNLAVFDVLNRALTLRPAETI